MSSNELAHLFPSATHPGLHVAGQILGTLRALTAPGKGNDLRPEERPALVGIAALLGCERVQSYDLAPAAVQRAMSVAPARFKSALARCRTLLAESEPEPPSSRSSSRLRSQPTTPSTSRVSTMPAPSPPAIKIDPLSPFMTPRKKYRAATKDLSGLLTPSHKHSPAASSPLRHAATPRKRGAEDVLATPSKRVRVVEDLEATPTKASPTTTNTPGRKTPTKHTEEEEDVAQTPTRRASARAAEKRELERQGVAAFFATRPGGAPKNGGTEQKGEGSGERTPRAQRVADADLDAQIDRVLGHRTRLCTRPRRDWTFREQVWTPNAEGMERLLQAVAENASGKKGKDKESADTPSKEKEEGAFAAQIAAVVLAGYQ